MLVNERLTDGFTGIAEGLLDGMARLWLRRNGGSATAVDLDVPAVVVTGGSGGIGLAIAAEFARRGRCVLLVGRDRARLNEAAERLRGELAEASRTSKRRQIADAAGIAGRIATLSVDVAAPDAAEQIGGALERQGWVLDVLVNAAAVGLSGPLASQSAMDVERLVAINVTGLVALTHWALQKLLARNRGGIINVASIAGYVPGPNQAAYYASKAFVCSLTSALRAETARTGVRVMTLSPGPVNTRFHAKMGAEASAYRQLIPALSPERVARSAVVGYALHRGTVVPGLLPKLFAVTLHVMPEIVSLPIMRVFLATRGPAGNASG